MNNHVGTQIDSYTIQAEGAATPALAFYQVMSADSAHEMEMAYLIGGANDADRSRLIQDRAALIQLRHPNLARVVDVGVVGADIFVVFEQLSGERLPDLLARRPSLPLGGVIDLLMQLGEALAMAHRQGVLHGALSPQSLFVRPGRDKDRWRVMLTHIGIYQYSQDAFPAALMPFLAPERLQGRAANGRSDVFSLGKLCQQLIAPDGDLASLAQQRADIVTIIEPIMQKATAVKMTARFRSINEMMNALRQANATLSTEQKQFALNNTPPAPPSQVQPPPVPVQVPIQPPTDEMTQADAAIYIAHPTQPERLFPLTKWLITAGSSPKNDLVLDETDVAGRHVRIEQSDSGWTVVDLGNAIGTELNGTRLLPDVKQAWHQGQILQVGSYELRWQSVQSVSEQSRAMPQQVVPQLIPLLKPIHAQVKPGDLINYNLDIINESFTWHQLDLTVKGLPSEWISIATSPIKIPPERSIAVPMAIQPPLHSSAKVGLHPFEIVAHINGQEAAGFNCKGKVDVLPYQHVDTMMSHAPLKHNEAGHLTIKNSGNVGTTCEVRIEDPAKEVEFRVDNVSIELQAGEEKIVEVTAVASKRPIFLQSKLTSYNVRVRYGNKHATQRHQLLIPPLISWLILGIIAVPLLLAGLLGGRAYLCNSGSYAFCASAIESGGDETIAVPTNATVGATAETAAADGDPTTIAPTATVIGAGGEGIGTSTNGKPIHMHRFGVGEHAILFIGGIHYGYAPSSVTLANQVVSYYQENPEEIPDNVSLYIIPNMNPDSVVNAGQRDGRFNANNVDLNRNWPCGWSENPEVLNQIEPGGGGGSALSEKESLVINQQVEMLAPTAVIFWDAANSIEREVSPGQCESSHQSSTLLSELYSQDMSQFISRQVETFKEPTGDISNSLAEREIPAVLVFLTDLWQEDVQTHIPGIQAVMEHVSENGGFD